MTVVGVRVSADGQLLYACSSDPGFGKLTGSAKPAITAFRIADGTPAGRFELPGGGFCNDLTELGDGTILATDSFKPRIYAVSNGAIRVWLEDTRFEGKGFNLNGIAAVSGAVYVVRYNTGSLYRITVNPDGSAGEVSEVTLSRTLRSPDGLSAVSSIELIVVEGGGLHAGALGSLARIRLDRHAGDVDVIADGLKVPTTAALWNGRAYVVEGQLDTLFDKTAGPPEAFRVRAIPVK